MKITAPGFNWFRGKDGGIKRFHKDFKATQKTQEDIKIEYQMEMVSKENLSKLLRESFATAPWFEELTQEEGDKRADSILSKKDVRCLVAKIKNEVVGCILFDTLDLETLKKERGQEIHDWAKERGLAEVGWEREVMVSPRFQSAGIGKELRNRILQEFEKNSTYKTFLTRMRDDNIKILKGAEKFGYQRTGVRLKSSMGENIWHEYWFKKIN